MKERSGRSVIHVDARKAQERFQILAVDAGANPFFHLLHTQLGGKLPQRFEIHAVEDLLRRKGVVRLLPDCKGLGDRLVESVRKLPVLLSFDGQDQPVRVDGTERSEQVETAFFS